MVSFSYQQYDCFIYVWERKLGRNLYGWVKSVMSWCKSLLWFQGDIFRSLTQNTSNWECVQGDDFSEPLTISSFHIQRGQPTRRFKDMCQISLLTF